MKFVFSLILLSTVLASSAIAELPKNFKIYDGYLTGRQIRTVIDWKDAPQVSGMLYPFDDKSVKIFLQGYKEGEDKLKLGVYDGVTRKIIGTVILTKTVSKQETTWTGEVNFNDESTSLMEISRRNN